MYPTRMLPTRMRLIGAVACLLLALVPGLALNVSPRLGVTSRPLPRSSWTVVASRTRVVVLAESDEQVRHPLLLCPEHTPLHSRAPCRHCAHTPHSGLHISQEITDLTLEDMFEVFEEADKTIDGPTDSAKAPARETAEEAWSKAPEGSFLSPAVIAGLAAVSLGIRFVVFGPDGASL